MADGDDVPLIPLSDAFPAKHSKLGRCFCDGGRAVIFVNAISATLIAIAMMMLSSAYNDPEYARKVNIYGAAYVYLRENYRSIMIFSGVSIAFNIFFIFGARCYGLWMAPKRLLWMTGSLLDSIYWRSTLKRITFDARTEARPLGLTDLPDVIFAHTSSYLSRESAALFAAAMRHMPHHSIQREKAITARSSWRTLDFSGINRRLAAKLSDEDVSAVLVAIDAVNVLKKLRLTGCTNLTGSGLKPLRGSTVLKCIDLTLLPRGSMPAGTKPLLCADTVIPILTSIESLREVRGENIILPNFWSRKRLLRRRDQFVYSFFPAIHCEFCRKTRQFASRVLSCDVCGESACCGSCEASAFARRCRVCGRAVCRGCHGDPHGTIEMLDCDDRNCKAVSGCHTVCRECLPRYDPRGRDERWCARCMEKKREWS